MTFAEFRDTLPLGTSEADAIQAYAEYLSGSEGGAEEGATPAGLKLRYPAFASVSDEVIAYWLADAALTVTDAWGADAAPAALALAAHKMATTPGVLPMGPDNLPAGVTSFRSGSFSVSVAESKAGAAGLQSTPYGQQYAAMLRRNSGGPRLVGLVA